MNIKDKIIISRKKWCMPHYFPHKLPFDKKIIDEPCHYHNAWWRMIHHIIGCFLWCKHYEFMIEQYKKAKKK